MRIVFDGLDHPVDVAGRGITVLQIKSKRLFARICESMITLQGTNAVESFSVWDNDGCEVRPASALFVIASPFELPWKHKDFMGSMYTKFEKELLVDEELRGELQNLHLMYESSISKLGFQLNADYKFGIEWSMNSYLKAFSYEVDISDTATLLEKIISFVDLGADMNFDKALVFINLKTFLSENDLMKLQEHLVFLGLSVLLLENYDAPYLESCEKKYLVDQDFIEYVFDEKTECPSSSQGRICSNGFGAVAF